MALIKLSSVGITNISGKAGGSIYSRNAGGSYVKNFAAPVNPDTAAQRTQRSIFGSIATSWSALSQEQRKSWAAAAVSFPRTNAFGDQRSLTGFSLFISLNRNLKLVGAPMITVAPIPSEVRAILTASVAATADDGTGTTFDLALTATASDAQGSFTTLIYATPPLSPGVSSAKNRLRLIGISGPLTQDITNFYTDTFAEAPAGSKIIFSLVSVNTETGERSAAFGFSSIVEEPVVP